MNKYFSHLSVCLLVLVSACSKGVDGSNNGEPGDNQSEEKVHTIPAPEGFTGVKYGEWTYMIRTDVIDTYAAKSAVTLLRKNLDEIDALLPEKALSVMHKQPLWLEKDLTDGAAWYHTSKEWLRSQNYMEEKWHCVELCNYIHYVSWSKQNQPYMVLHELCHLFHDQGLPGGFENADVKGAYESAMSDGLYVNTAYRLDANTIIEHYDDTYHQKVYATTNCMEYFSEICEAYWGQNDYFPFDYEDLKTYDPYGFALMEKIWGSKE